MHISRLYLHSARFKATANKEGRERIPGHIGLLKYMKLPSLSAQETEQMKKELKFKQSSQEEEKQATCRSIQSNHHNTCGRIVDRESCKELQIQSSDKEKIVDDRAIRYGPESDELENHPETTVSWHLASDSGAEALAFLQQGGSSSSGVLRASESFPAPSPAMDPVPPPWGFQPLVQICPYEGSARSKHPNDIDKYLSTTDHCDYEQQPYSSPLAPLPPMEGGVPPFPGHNLYRLFACMTRYSQ
ncbi:hypothetical protein BHM03_00047113 [Ensete ventricosum]|nr:hypothetical protein BHM03_00047113 [Ensete ventricosum]